MRVFNLFKCEIYSLLPLCMVIFYSNLTIAQVQVWNNSNVTIGWANTAPNENLNVHGDSYFKPASSTYGSSITGFHFRNYLNNITSTGGTGSTWFNEPMLWCQWSKTAWIGTANEEIYRVFATRLYSSDGLVHTSDRRLKTNIKEWEGSALSKIHNLKVYRYDMDATKFENVPEEKKAVIAEEAKNKIGFIAEELQEEFPEMVKPIPGTEYLGVDYTMMIPVLLEAINEQQALILELQEKILKLEGK